MKFVKTKKNVHKSPNTGIQNSVSVMDVFEKKLEKKGECNTGKFHFINQNTIEVNNIPSMALHSLVLDLEGLRKNIVVEKSTTITIEK